MKQKNKEESGTQIAVNVVNASLRLLIRKACVVRRLIIRKACVVRTLTKFMKNYLKGKNALQNPAGSEWFTGKTNITCFIIGPLSITW